MDINSQINHILNEEKALFILSGICGFILLLISLFILFIIKYRSYIAVVVPMTLSSIIIIVYAYIAYSHTLSLSHLTNTNVLNSIYLAKQEKIKTIQLLLICLMSVTFIAFIFTRHHYFWKHLSISTLLHCVLWYVFYTIYLQLVTKIIVILQQ